MDLDPGGLKIRRFHTTVYVLWVIVMQSRPVWKKNMHVTLYRRMKTSCSVRRNELFYSCIVNYTEFYLVMHLFCFAFLGMHIKCRAVKDVQYRVAWQIEVRRLLGLVASTCDSCCFRSLFLAYKICACRCFKVAANVKTLEMLERWCMWRNQSWSKMWCVCLLFADVIFKQMNCNDIQLLHVHTHLIYTCIRWHQKVVYGHRCEYCHLHIFRGLWK